MAIDLSVLDEAPSSIDLSVLDEPKSGIDLSVLDNEQSGIDLSVLDDEGPGIGKTVAGLGAEVVVGEGAKYAASAAGGPYLRPMV